MILINCEKRFVYRGEVVSDFATDFIVEILKSFFHISGHFRRLSLSLRILK